MEKRSILHMLDPTPNNSPFDINMAVDAGFDILMPYSNVKLDSVYRLTQDAIFSRGPAGVKRTALFIGGRDLGLAIDMLDTARQAMVPTSNISFEIPFPDTDLAMNPNLMKEPVPFDFGQWTECKF